MKISAITTLALLAAVACGGAQADTYARLTEVIRYGDLDLGRTDGMAVLFQRIENARRRVCGPLHSYLPWRELDGSYNACIKKTLSDVVVRVGRPEFTEYVLNRVHLTPVQAASR